MNRSRHILGSGLAATVILALGHFLVPDGWSGVFAFLRRTAAQVVSGADALISVPVWWLALIAALFLSALGTAAYVISRKPRKHATGSEPATDAEILGIRWRWHYQQGDVRNLTSYCPKCDRQVRPRTETRHGFLNLISYPCECGHWRSKSFQCSHREIIDRVCRTIQKHART